MSDFSSEGEISERTDSGCESDNSPRFGEGSEDEENNQINEMMDLKIFEVRNEDFEIAQEGERDEGEGNSSPKELKTFYKEDKENPFKKNSFNGNENKRKSCDPTKYQPQKKNLQLSQNTNIHGRMSGFSKGQGDNEELNFMLSHSNTLLTSEIPDEARKNSNKNIVDIDEDSNEQYEDFEEHLCTIEEKIDNFQGLIEEEKKERKFEMEQINEKLDKILSLFTTTRNDVDFSKYRTNTFVNTSIQKVAKQKLINEEEKEHQNNIVQEFDNSEALLNNMVESQKRSDQKKLLKAQEKVKSEIKGQQNDEDKVEYFTPREKEGKQDLHKDVKEKEVIEVQQKEDDLELEDIVSIESQQEESLSSEGEESEIEIEKEETKEKKEGNINTKGIEDEKEEDTTQKENKSERNIEVEDIISKLENDLEDEFKQTMKHSDTEYKENSPQKSEIVNHESIQLE